MTTDDTRPHYCACGHEHLAASDPPYAYGGDDDAEAKAEVAERARHAALVAAAQMAYRYAMLDEADGGYCRVCSADGIWDDPHDGACWVGALRAALAGEEAG